MKYFKLKHYLIVINYFWPVFGSKSFSKYSVSFIKKLYFFVLILPHAGRLFAWRTSKKSSKLAEEVNRSNQIFASVLSPYLNKNWKLINRINAVEQHYQAVDSFASLLDLASDQYFDLIEFKDEYADVRIVIDKPDWMRVEGEVVISFFYKVYRIHRLVFSIIQHEETHVITVGSVQGWGGTDTIGAEEVKQINVKLTKLLHGLHPKIFLLYILKMLGVEWNLKEIWGVSDASHRSNHWLVNSRKFSSYDNFWLEHSGVYNQQSFYAIPTEIRMKPYDEIPANKRARFRRRYEMLGQVRNQLKEVVQHNRRTIKTHVGLLKSSKDCIVDFSFMLFATDLTLGLIKF